MYRANLIARNLHASSENRRKQERLFEKEILPLGLKIKGIAQRILEELMKASPEIVDREHLTAAIWPDDDVPDADSLRANIYLLRQAVDKPFATALIRTHTGAGWSIGRSQR